MKKNEYKGKFIVIEGANGVGKTSFIEALKKEIDENDNVVFTKEITNSSIGKFSYEVMEQIGPKAFACLMAADRYEHLEKVIIPSLKDGKKVICDRYFLSSLTYQCMDGLSQEFIRDLNQEIIIPDLTVVLRATKETLINRKKKRAKKLDRFEIEKNTEKEIECLEKGIKVIKNWHLLILNNENQDLFEKIRAFKKLIINNEFFN